MAEKLKLVGKGTTWDVPDSKVIFGEDDVGIGENSGRPTVLGWSFLFFLAVFKSFGC